MNLALWITQGLLAAIFLAAGGMKLAKSKEQLVAGGQAALEPYSPSVIRTLGTLEVLGAIGLILPWLTDVAPVLTPLAAVGLAILMTAATVVHVRRKEPPITLLFLLAALFVAIGRFADL